MKQAYVLAIIALVAVVISGVQAKNTKRVIEHGPTACVEEEGEMWCQKEAKCVKPWELAKEKNFDFKGLGIKSFIKYCGPLVKTPHHHNLHLDSTSSLSTPATTTTTTTLKNHKKSAPGSTLDEHGCTSSAGYTWCAKENKCIRPWELAKEKSLTGDAKSITSYCSGCLSSAGYSWCEAEGKCVRPWELAKEKSFGLDATSFNSYCSGKFVASVPETKTNKKSAPKVTPTCDTESGYSWCAREMRCMKPSDISSGKNIGPESFARYCAQPAAVQRQVAGAPIQESELKIGGKLDNHGCFGSAGYSWCQAEGKCVRLWELAKEKYLQTTEVKDYCAGQPCNAGTGYSWCATEGKCVRPWELAAARQIENTESSFKSYCTGKRY